MGVPPLTDRGQLPHTNLRLSSCLKHRAMIRKLQKHTSLHAALLFPKAITAIRALIIQKGIRLLR